MQMYFITCNMFPSLQQGMCGATGFCVPFRHAD